MFKIRGSVDRIKSLPKYLKTNSYSFTPEEAGITSLPQSMFIPSIISVSGSVSAFVMGAAMTATSVEEVGIPLLAASVAGITAPFAMKASQQKKLRKEVAEGLTALLPQLILEGVPAITEEQASLLIKGKAVEVRLSSGSVVAIRLGGKVQGNMDERIAGTVYLLPAKRGTEEFDALLGTLQSRDRDVAKALETASAKNSKKALNESLRSIVNVNPTEPGRTKRPSWMKPTA